MSVNRVTLYGRLGADPELRYTPKSVPVVRLRIATNERRKDDSGNWVETTDWHSVVVFGRTAENCNQYLKKGSEAFLEGRLQTRKWQDKEGKDRYTTEVIANNVQFVGGRSAPAGEKQPTGGPAPVPQPEQSAVSAVDWKDLPYDDDDIPW